MQNKQTTIKTNKIEYYKINSNFIIFRKNNKIY